MTAFSIILIVFQSLANLSHLLWTFWLAAEQLRTGWGFGTAMELGVLYPWLTELLCTPVLLAAAVYFIISFFKRNRKGLLITNIVLFIAALGQFALTNLFIWF